MSRFMVGLKIFLMFVLCTGVKGEENPMAHCLETIKYEGLVASFVKLTAAEGFDVTCSKMKRVIICVKDVVKKYLFHDVKELAILFKGTEVGKSFQIIANTSDLIEELCKEGTQLQKDYLMDVKCFRNFNGDALEQCQKEAEAASDIFRYLNRKDSSYHAVDQPCVFTSYKLGCLGAAVLEECGNRAFHTYKEIVKKTGFFKVGICPPDVIHTLNTTIIDILENAESRRSVYHVILALKKRRK